MTKKKFKFPKGTTTISPKEMEEALCNYEIVEVPGTVSKVQVKAEGQGRKFIAKELILHEGTLELDFGNSSQNIRYNVPKSVHTIICFCRGVCDGFMAPKVLCLNLGFRRATGLKGVEYLQHHSLSCVNWSFRNLKHYVYLGTTMNRKEDQFARLTPGTVIHVENKTVAKSVLKRVNIFETYVVVDAQEWKDFPADKLALTMEEYDPESRILPLQKKMREEELQEKAEKERQEREEERQRQKERMAASITKPIITEALSPLCDKLQIASGIYENANGEEFVMARLLFNNIQWVTVGDKTESTEFHISIPLLEVEQNAEKAAEVVRRLNGVLCRNQQLMQSMKITLNGTMMEKDSTVPLLILPFGNCNTICADLNWETMFEDSKALYDFAKELAEIIETAKTNDGIVVEMKNMGLWFDGCFN